MYKNWVLRHLDIVLKILKISSNLHQNWDTLGGYFCIDRGKNSLSQGENMLYLGPKWRVFSILDFYNGSEWPQGVQNKFGRILDIFTESKFILKLLGSFWDIIEVKNRKNT